MKHLIVTLITILSFNTLTYSQSISACHRIEKVQQVLNTYHFQPISFSVQEKIEVIDLFLIDIDEEGLIFSKEISSEIKKIASEQGLCNAFEFIKFQYTKCYSFYDSISNSILRKTIQYRVGENITFPEKNISRKEISSKDQLEEIKKYVKYLVLSELFNETRSENSTEKIQFSKEKEEKIRNEIQLSLKEEMEWLKNNNEEVNEFLLEKFLNAVALRFDPHSNYFSYEQKNELLEDLSAEHLIFGISYRLNDEKEFIISDIAPGSSAWNSNEINVGDILESIQKSKEKKIDLKGKNTKFLNQLFNELSDNEVTLYLRKESGDVRKVELIRTKVENVDNAFRGYLIKDDKVKIGYISLPSFYTDTENQNELGCANDVAKEILLLKKDSIQGLILDLRNNGGGSMKEAVELAGLFIDQGVVSIYQEKGVKPILLKDINRGTVYDGPLIVLVNNMSASASEFFTGCMKDYRRAIIVGTNTFGKGTAQNILPVDTLNKSIDKGYLKITMGKFYHVSSYSNQELGVQPDIQLNELYSTIDYFSEKKLLYHILNDKSTKKVSFVPETRFFNEAKIAEIKDKYEKSELQKDIYLKSVKLKSFIEEQEVIPLDFIGFCNYFENKNKQMETLKIDSFVSKLNFENHSFSNKMSGYNMFEKKFNEKIIENLKKDYLLNDSFYILKDVFNFTK